MVERRNREQKPGVKGAHPGKRDKGVAFPVGIVNSRGLLVRGVWDLVESRRKEVTRRS